MTHQNYNRHENRGHIVVDGIESKVNNDYQVTVRPIIQLIEDHRPHCYRCQTAEDLIIIE